MPTIADLREAFPSARDLSDEEILDRISTATRLPIQQVANDFGYDLGGGKNANRLSASIDNYQAGLYGVGEAIAGEGGWFTRQRQRNEIQANVASGRARDLGAVDAWRDVNSLSDFGDYAVGLGIQSLPYMGEAVVGGMTGGALAPSLGIRAASGVNAMRLGGAAAASYPSAVGDILQSQRDQAGETDLLSAAALGVPYAAANAVGVEGALARGALFRNTARSLDNVNGVTGGLARAGATGARVGLTEGASEVFQEGMNQFGRMAVDPNETFFNPESNERFLESAVGGATLGGIMGGAAGGWRRSSSYTNNQVSLLNDAPTEPDPYAPPDSLTDTPVTELPGFASRPNDPLQTVLNPQPSININPNAAQDNVAVANSVANPPTQQTAKPGQAVPAPVTQEERQGANERYRTETVLDDGTEEGHWRVFGKDFFKRSELNKALDKQATEDRDRDPKLLEFEKELNAAGPAFPRPAKLQELASQLFGSTPEKTAYNLDAAIKGGHKEADRLAAVYEQITGKESPAWKASQEPKPAKEKAEKIAEKAKPQPAAVATQPRVFEDGDTDGMLRATLMALYNNNEKNVDIAMEDIAEEKVAKITEKYGVTDSLVRKLRQRRAPKAMEYAMKKAGVDPEVLRTALEKSKAPTTAAVEDVVTEEGATREVTDSDERPLALQADEELTAEQQESDAFATAGMSVREGSGTQVGDASARNNSRAKLEAAKGKVSSKSLTPADLNNLWIEAVEKDDRKLAKDIEDELLLRHKRGELSQADMDELSGAADEQTVLPAGQQEDARASAETAAPAAPRTTRAKKEPKGKVGTEWDKIVRQVAKAKVEVPAWDTLSPEQKIKATDKFALNGKLTMHEVQDVVGSKPAPAKAPAPTPAPAPKIDEKSAATVAKVQRSKAPSVKEATGQDFMAKLNEAAARKKAAPDAQADNMEAPRRLVDVLRERISGEGAPKGWGRIEGDVERKPEENSIPNRPYAHTEVMTTESGEKIVYSQVTDPMWFFKSHAAPRVALMTLAAEDVDHILHGIDYLSVAEGERTRWGGFAVYARYPDGSRGLEISATQLDSPQGMFTILHEAGHAADLVHVLGEGVGTFSGSSELAVLAKEDKESGPRYVPVGAVAEELHKLYETNPSWKFLRYPFNRFAYNKLTLNQARKELFAQMFAAYLANPDLVQQDAPLTHAFMEKALEQIRQTNFAAELVKTKARAKTENPQQRPTGDAYRSGVAVERIETTEGAPEVPRSRTQGGREGSGKASRQAERLIENLPQASRSGARRLYTTIADAAKKGFYGAAFTWDLADIAAKQLPSVTKYMQLMGKKAAVKTHLEDQVEKILAQSERMSKTDRLGRAQTGTGEHSVNKFLYDSTLTGKWGYKDDPNSKIQVDPEMAERFENFSDDAKQLIRQVFKYGADTLRMKQRIIKDEINNEFRQLSKDAGYDPEKVEELEKKRRAALQHYDSILFLTNNKPYAPLRRFGNYVVIARSQAMRDAMANDDKRAIERMQSDENHYFVAFYETLGEADEQAARLQATGKYAETSAFEKEKGLDAIYGGRDMMTAFQRLRNLIKSELEMDPNDQVAKSLNGMISDLYLHTLAETSARKAEIKRRNVAGADLDMLRAFATQGRADAHFIAALKHNGEVTDAMYEMRREAHEPGGDKAQKMRLFNEFMSRHALHMNYTETRVQDAIMRGTSLWMLATSPAYYLQNATQTPMISVPYMAGKHGYGRSWSAISQAYKDLGPMIEGLSWSERMDFTKSPADVRRMLTDLVAAGRIDIALDQDLGRFQSRADNVLGHTWNTVDRKLRGMQQRVEAINRVTAAVAAYRMELARNGGNHHGATEYASKVVRITHGDYSAFNSPRYFTPGGGLPLAKVITQFRKFQVIQASLIVRLFNNAFMGDVSPQERAIARKALAFTLGHTAAIGGMYGLPGAGTIAWLVSKLLSDGDEPDNDELALRRLIGNEDMADLILKGAPAYFGLDLSGKLGMGNAFSLMPYARVTGFDRDSYSKGLLALSGPFIGGLVPRAMDGIEQIGRGNWYKGVEQLLPSGFANAMRAYRFQDEGVTKRNNDVMLDADEVSFATTLFQALGLQTKQLTDRTFDQQVISEFEQFYKDKSARLSEKYARAARAGDRQAMAKIREEWMELQDSRARNGFKRQPLSVLLRAPVKQQRREREVVNGLGATRNTRALAEELDEI